MEFSGASPGRHRPFGCHGSRTVAQLASEASFARLMKIMRICCFAFVSLALLRNGSGQDFVNLDFENATIISDLTSGYYPYAVYASEAAPGWTVTGFLGPTDLLYNDQSLGATSAALFGLNSTYSPPPLDGAFSIDLYGGAPGPGAMPPGASISQTGLVPVSARSILFIANLAGGSPTLLVSLGGRNIPYSAVSTGPGYTMYGGNIPVFAGRSENLTFTALEGVNNYCELDDIQFSPSSVPEPSTLSLFSICVLLLWWRVKRPYQSPGPTTVGRCRSAGAVHGRWRPNLRC